jgi:hypothetical protein
MSAPASFASELAVAMARMKSYTGSAAIAFLLYSFFWLPGLIVNYMLYREAKQTEKVAGQSLPGVGCLTLMLILNLVVVVLGFFFACCSILYLVMAVGAINR